MIGFLFAFGSFTEGGSGRRVEVFLELGLFFVESFSGAGSVRKRKGFFLGVGLVTTGDRSSKRRFFALVVLANSRLGVTGVSLGLGSIGCGVPSPLTDFLA